MKKNLISLLVLVIVVVLLSACNQPIRGLGNNAATEIPAATIMSPATLAAEILQTATLVVPANTTVAPTQTATPAPQPPNADELFNGSKFPGVLPEFARDNANYISKVAGLTYHTANNTDVGSDNGWNSPTGVDSYAEWTKYLAWQTVWDIPAGASVTFTMIYDTILLDRGDISYPYSSWLNAITNPNNGQYMAEGLALTAPNPLTVNVSYNDGPVCTASSVQLVPDTKITVSMACPKGSPVNCQFSVGQYGQLMDIRTGQVADASVQKTGGNIAAPGCLYSSFPGPYQWIQGMK